MEIMIFTVIKTNQTLHASIREKKKIEDIYSYQGSDTVQLWS